MLASLLVLFVVALPRSAEVRGLVRDADSGAPIPGARVAIVGTRLMAATDASGEYRLVGIASGVQRLRVAARGFNAREVQLLVPDAGEMRVDVELTEHPSLLANVRIKARARIADGPAGLGLDSALTLDHAVVIGDWQGREIAGRADLNSVLATVPGVGGRGEPPVAVHARGGAADQNLLLVDGFPVYSATHFGEVGSAINPDVVRRVDFHVGVSPASYGDRLASTIAIETDAVEPAGLSFPGLVGTGQVRQMVAATRPSGSRLFVAVRRSYGSPLGRGTSSDPRNGFADVIGTATILVASDTLRLLGFASGNQLGFDAITDTSLLAGQAESPAGTGDVPRIRSNAFEWASRTVGVSWNHRSSATLWVRSRAWQSASSVDLGWWSADTVFGATSRLREDGFASTAMWRLAHRTVHGGFSATRVSTRYAVSGGSALAAGPAMPRMTVAGLPGILATFVDVKGHVGRLLNYQLGLRSVWRDGGWLGLEPRLLLGLSPRPWMSVRASAGRITQSVQSVRNEESVLGSALGFELPVADGTVPVANALHGSLAVGVRPTAGVSIEAAGYVARQRGLILVAPSSTQPFATEPVHQGNGRVRGVAMRVAFERGRFGASLGYVLDAISRWTDSTKYQPRFAAGQSGVLAVRYRWRPATVLQGDFLTGAGAPASATLSGFEWEAGSGVRRSGELSGDPVNAGGRVNPLKLPAFASLDIGIQHSWQLGSARPAHALSLSVAVRNVLNGRQGVGFVSTDAAPRLLMAARRSLAASLSWRF